MGRFFGITVAVLYFLCSYGLAEVAYVRFDSECKDACGSVESPYPNLSGAIKRATEDTNISDILVMSGNYSGDLNVGLLLSIQVAISVVPEAQGKVIFVCGASTRALNISAPLTTIRGLIFDGCSSSEGGALRYEGGVHTIDSVEFSNANATSNGGAIYAKGASLNITSPKFSKVIAVSSGNWIYLDVSSANITSTQVAGDNDIACKNGTVRVSGAISSNVSTICTTCDVKSMEGTVSICPPVVPAPAPAPAPEPQTKSAAIMGKEVSLKSAVYTGIFALFTVLCLVMS